MPTTMTADEHRSADLTHALASAAALLGAARRVWLGTHIDPDGDAIGSTIGLARVLRAHGANVVVACQDPVPPETLFLPGISDFVTHGPEAGMTVVVLDVADRGRVGDVLDPGIVPDLVIDHHISNAGFGIVNLIDPTSASTAEIVLELADAMGYVPDSETATCLLTGVVTDTNAFRTTNTTAATLRAAARLMSAGADLPAITAQAFRRPLATMRLAARAVERLELFGPFAMTIVTQDDLNELGVPDSAMRGITMLLADVAEPEVVAVLREREDGTVDVSMRSKRGVDLVKAARSLGGGGHPQASGARLDMPIADAASLVRDALETHVGPGGRPA